MEIATDITNAAVVIAMTTPSVSANKISIEFHALKKLPVYFFGRPVVFVKTTLWNTVVHVHLY